MTLTIKSVTSDLIDDLGQLFSTDKVADQCWCMWFIIPVKEFHALGHEGNRASFCELVASSEQPLGLLAYQNDEPVGWCAVGPRSRYVRALKTPTYITFILESIYEKTRLTMRQENFHSEVEYKHANFFWGVALHVMKNLLEQTD